MLRKTSVLLIPMVIGGLVCTALAKPKEITDPEQAKADPDFSIQGEYVGEGVLDDGSQIEVGAQVIAQGKGEFRVVLYEGGLPGAGWQRGMERFFMEGTAAEFTGEGLAGKIVAGKLSVKSTEDSAKAVLKRVERKSPTLGAKPPEGAVVIFDGSNLDQLVGGEGHLTECKSLLSGVTTKPLPEDHQLHLEFRLSWMPEARGQGRSNSGVYIHNCYECQVLDSFGLEGYNNECGGFYSIKEPDVNMCLPPMVWQTYDIDFTAPKYDGDKRVSKARITIRHNGVVIHDNVELPHDTPGAQSEGPGPRPIHLQGHGNKVFYRNIWVKAK